MNEPNAPRRYDDMDELTAVQQLLAERPPPTPDAVAAARASLKRAGLRATPGPAPLRLGGGPNLLGAGRPARRRHWRGWLAPVGAAMAVIIAVGASLAVVRIAGAPPGRNPAGRGAAAFAQVPPYFVALTGGNTLPDEGRRVVAAATATGAVLGSVTAPAPYRVFTWVAAARDDRTFVLAAQRARPVPGDTADVMGAGAAKLYRLVLSRSGRPGALEPLRLPLVTGAINGFALSPDGSKLAVSSRPVGRLGHSQIQVFTLATGAVRSWVPGRTGWVGQDKPNAESLVWAGDNRTLLFKEYLGEGGTTAQIRLLDTAAPGGFLPAASTLVPFRGSLISGRVEDPEQDYGNMLLLPDGRKIISVMATFTWQGRPGFAPSGGYGRALRGMLPPQCRGTGRQIAKNTPYCADRRKHLDLGKGSAVWRYQVRQEAQSGTSLAFTEFSAATAKPVAVLARLQGEGEGTSWAEVTWVSPAATAMIIDGAWPKFGGSWPVSHDGPPLPVAGVLSGGTFTPFPRPVQSLFFSGQATW